MEKDRNQRKRVSIPLKRKFEIIKKLQSGESQTAVAAQENLERQTVNQIWKKRDVYLNQFENLNGDLKKCKQKKFEQVDSALIDWFKVQRDRNIPVGGPLLLEKAKQFAEEFGLSEFRGSVGWLDKWKQRHSISFRTVSGESASVNLNQVSNWLEEKWKPISQEYEPKNIFNCDETGLFWRMLPEKTLAFKNEVCSGGKLSKERITVLLCANMDGSNKLEPLVIGKSANPRAFKKISSRSVLPVSYRSNSKAWMTSALFEEWLQKVDKTMQTQRRNILLVLDNCPAHPSKIQLKNIRLLFLPPNTTSVSQPLDQGIIQNFKLKYRQRLLRLMITRLDSGNLTQIDILDAIMLLGRACDDVTPSCVENCFIKAGFNALDSNVLEESEELVLEEMEEYNVAFGVNEQVPIQDFVNVDNNVITNETPTDEDILQLSIRPSTPPFENEASEDEQPILEEVSRVSNQEYFRSLDALKTWLLQQKGPMTKELNMVHHLEDAGYKLIASKKKQKLITEFV